MKHNICLTIRSWVAAESGELQATSPGHTHAYAVIIVHSDDGATSKIVGIQRTNGGGISIFEFNRRKNIKIITLIIHINVFLFLSLILHAHDGHDDPTFKSKKKLRC
jgi:hypothetical protein